MVRTSSYMHALLLCLLAAWAAQTQPGFAQQAAPTAQAPVPARQTPAGAGTLRFLAVGHNGSAIEPLRAEELSLRIDKEPRKILSVAPANDEPRTIGFFFDVSGSRHADKLIGREVQESSKLLESVWKKGDDGFVVDFDGDLFTVAKPTTDLHTLQAALLTIPDDKPRGCTAVYDALRAVGLRSQAAEREKLFIVVSDFEDNCSGTSMEQMVETMRNKGAHVFALLPPEFGSSSQHGRRRDMKAAKGITEKTGGDLFDVKDYEDLAAAFQRLASEANGAYRLTYEASPAEGKRRKVELRTTRQNVNLLFARD